MAHHSKIISVFGSSAPAPGSADYEAARTVGRLLAEAGFAVQTGGYGGVMAGASQGASEAGGHVIGVTSAHMERWRPVPPNRWVAEEKKHDAQVQRLLYLVNHCDGVIVMSGGIGTLSEMALVWSLVQVGEIPARPIILVGGLWQRTLAAFLDEAYVRPEHQELLTIARTAPEAVQKLTVYLEER